MKKYILTALMALIGICANAQYRYYAGGTLGFWHSKQNDVTTNTFAILPEIGMSLDEHWGIGTTIGYSLNHTCDVDITTHLFEFNPYARYTYFRSDNGMVNLFVDGTVGLGLGRTTGLGTACTWQIGVTPGIAINLTDRFCIAGHVGFLGYKGANNAAKAGGHAEEGGILLNGQSLTLSFYVNF